MRWIASQIWNFSERYNVPLGRLAPWIFGMMIGKIPYKKKEKK